MADETKVVNPAEATNAEQGVVNQTADATQQPEVTNSEVAQPENQPSVQPLNADVDEFGVPWKNRAMEWKRKSEELTDRLPQIIEEKLRSFTQPAQQPKYSYEELEVFKTQNLSNPQSVAWATAEQRKIQQEEQRKLFEDVVVSRDRVREADDQRRRSFEFVRNTYPDAMNPNHPMAQGIKNYMSFPEIANNPRGLEVAAKMAYADYAMAQTPVLQNKIQQQKTELKSQQRNSMVEGGGRKVVQSAPPQQAALEQLKKTGSITDASSAVGAILKAQGVLKE